MPRGCVGVTIHRGADVTKTGRILELYDGKRTTREIAHIVGTTDAYVRVVARQRKGSMSATDRRWRASPKGEAALERYKPRRRERLRERYATDADWRERKKAASRADYRRRAEARAS